MADSFSTLADLAKVNDANLADIDVTDILDDAPFLKALAADESSNGETHKYLKETGAPVVGFRAANDGRENSKSADTLVTVTPKILDASFTVDKAVADIYRRGPNAWLGREGVRHWRAAISLAEKQLLYGTGQEAGGFTGLADASTIDAVADTMVVDAGGTTAATASSVFAVRTNANGTDVTLIGAGEGGNSPSIALKMGETIVQRVAGATGTYPAYYTPAMAWLALQIGSAYSVGRIANLTADAGKGLTDDLIADMLSQFPATRKPNYLVCSRRSLKQLQQSRTATNATGAPAPFPTESHNVPLVVTDSVKDTEAILA